MENIGKSNCFYSSLLFSLNLIDFSAWFQRFFVRSSLSLPPSPCARRLIDFDWWISWDFSSESSIYVIGDIRSLSFYVDSWFRQTSSLSSFPLLTCPHSDLTYDAPSTPSQASVIILNQLTHVVCALMSYIKDYMKLIKFNL